MTKRYDMGLLLGLLIAGCDAADDVRVQELPPLDRASPEARVGLPEMEGVWRFAGWELAPGDSAGLEADLPAFGEIWLQTQRLDSLAGHYVAGSSRMPLVGEVRRDSVVSLAGGGRFLAGRVLQDTLWMSLTSLLEPGSWRTDARAAFVRAQVGSAFVRLHGALPALASADSLAADSARVAAGERSDSPVVPPVAGEPGPEGRVRQAPPARAEPEQRAEPAPRPQPQEPARAAPEPQPQPEPEPEPEPPAEPRRRQPRLLGEPVRRDTTGLSAHRPPPASRAGYSRAAASAISLPRAVSSRR